LITVSLVLGLISFSYLTQGQTETSVTFKVDVTEVLKKGQSISEVGLRGSNPPLSWEKNYPMTDINKDGIYEAEVSISNPKSLEYKFVLGSGREVEWETNSNRKLIDFSDKEGTVAQSIWDNSLNMSTSELLSLKIAPEGLQEDLTILQKALTNLHPGLNKYFDSNSLNAEFENLSQDFESEKTLREVYKEISLLVAKIKCGHTMTGAYNQSDEIEEVIMNQKDKLPFSTKIINEKMYIHHNVSEDDRLVKGSEVVSLNGVKVADIFQTLLNVTNADGSNDAMRYYKLQILGYGEHTDFDLYYSLFYPISGKKLELGFIAPGETEEFTTSIDPLTFQEREQRIVSSFSDIPQSYDDLWSLSYPAENVALLRLGTFVTWKMEMNWKKFMKDAFKEIQEKNIQHLIVDIRGNGGGLDAPSTVLVRNIIEKPFIVKVNQPYSKYTKVADEIKPYLSSWNNDAYDISNQVKPADNGLYISKNANKEFKLSPVKNSFKGKTYLVVDASNSSATYILAKNIKAKGVATLVGQTTGGNLKGINGGQMFFLTLPNSKVEVDIPLWGAGPGINQPDQGVVPNIIVEPSIQDLINNVDTEVKTILDLITQTKDTHK